MKKITTIVAAILMTASVWAQSPEKMSYQAVVRNSSNALITTQAVGMQISILQGGATGTPVYVETQTPTTNTNGLVSLELGTGTVVSGTFNTIDWANGTYFIKTETDPTGGTSYTITGTSQLMSVPYALHAKTAENITGTVNYTETDPTYTASQAANITTVDITNLSNLSGTNTGDQNISGITNNATAIGILQTEQTTQNTAIALNTAKTGITTAQATAITANTAKVGVTPAQVTILSNTSGTNTGDQDGSETKVTAGTNVTVTGTGTTASPYLVNATSGATTLAIGDSYQGGTIAWLDASGQHGLIAATTDQSTGVQWYNGSNTSTNAVRDGIGAGEFNSERIIANQGTGAYAAQICANYQGGNYGDWYLPSNYELGLLYSQRTAIGGFTTDVYWSSTEFGSNNAWRYNFNNGNPSTPNKFNTFRVRAVRAF